LAHVVTSNCELSQYYCSTFYHHARSSEACSRLALYFFQNSPHNPNTIPSTTYRHDQGNTATNGLGFWNFPYPAKSSKFYSGYLFLPNTQPEQPQHRSIDSIRHKNLSQLDTVAALCLIYNDRLFHCYLRLRISLPAWPTPTSTHIAQPRNNTRKLATTGLRLFIFT
jgi:hypothetical protein